MQHCGIDANLLERNIFDHPRRKSEGSDKDGKKENGEATTEKGTQKGNSW